MYLISAAAPCFTSFLQRRSGQLGGGDDRLCSRYLLSANQVLYSLSYIPIYKAHKKSYYGLEPYNLNQNQMHYHYAKILLKEIAACAFNLYN